MLELINVCKTFNPGTVNAKTALNDLNLTLNDGDFVTVIGGNGAGKSTMLNAIAGSFQIDSGKIVIDGTDVTGLPEHKRAAFLGRVFQDPMMGTAPTMQIEENLALAARRGQHRGLRWGITRAERAEYQKRLHALDLGLEDRMTAKVGLLSGGQRQALTLLMALPPVIFPTPASTSSQTSAAGHTTRRCSPTPGSRRSSCRSSSAPVTGSVSSRRRPHRRSASRPTACSSRARMTSTPSRSVRARSGPVIS